MHFSNLAISPTQSKWKTLAGLKDRQITARCCAFSRSHYVSGLFKYLQKTPIEVGDLISEQLEESSFPCRLERRSLLLQFISLRCLLKKAQVSRPSTLRPVAMSF
ncbi:hypothetical protein CDAR_473251 [Caerostris darwini]|uniref:Uncharacterized protein n=1 Tax=Caerostris darwini TaxID=1538125 RepID=A0AAV4PIP5_9ARAC|nr:hypothetical protein CDAR_473131 [Caerostris darwini]GIX97402.1 hypothetical protein CDAR_473251 [Caerostris darwini]